MIIEVWVERGLRHENSGRYSPDSTNGTITFLARQLEGKWLIGPMVCVTRIPPPRGHHGIHGNIDQRLRLGQ